MTASQPVVSSIFAAAAGESTSPLPMTGMETASFTCRMISQSAGGAYISSRVRPWTVTAEAPASSQIFAISTALTEFLSQPLRIFTVTGTGTARTTAETIARQSRGLFMRAEPEPLLAILGAGQPILISMKSGSYSMQIFAASAMISGS